MDDALVREARDGPIAVLTMDHPARRNALSISLRLELLAAFRRIETDPEVRAVVLTGAGGVFSSGGDISGMGRKPIAEGRERFRATHELVRLMAGLSKPIVAAVEGWAAGAGLSLALLCDTIAAAEDARFAASFNKVGLIGDFGLLHTLPLRVGAGRARQMLLYAEPVDAPAAERMGLVDHLAPKGGALALATARARVLAAAAPLPIALTKTWLADGLEQALARERDWQAMLYTSDDHAEGAAAFLEKRAPVFRGR
jgi:enoyl-CoA hydratase/carnithine racemase